jgi:hypothetical protein
MSKDKNLKEQQSQMNYEDVKNEIKKGSGFVKDYRDSLAVRIKLQNENKNALIIFDFLKFNMDNYNAIVCSSKLIEEALNLSESSVARAIKALQNNKFIEIAKTGSSNVYFINSNISWSTDENLKESSSFSAKVMIAKSEQTKIFEVKNEIKEKTKKAKQKIKVGA